MTITGNFIREASVIPRFTEAEFQAFLHKEEQRRTQLAQRTQSRIAARIQEQKEQQQNQRWQRPKQNIDWSRRVILADISTSMGAGAQNGKSRYQNLHDTIANILPQWPMRLVAFAINAKPCGDIHEMENLWRTRDGMGAGNNEIAALRCAQQFNPELTLLISDGGTYNASKVIDYARCYPGQIDTLYIGPADNHAAINFLRELATLKGGRCMINDLDKTDQPKLEESMKSLVLRDL